MENLCVENKGKIFQALSEGPKKFSELKKSTGLANGVLQHHINNSEKIIREKNTVMLADECQKCELKGLCQKKCVKNVLIDRKKFSIAKKLDKNFSQADIARELNVSRPTVHHHVEDLRENNILKREKLRPQVKNFLQD